MCVSSIATETDRALRITLREFLLNHRVAQRKKLSKTLCNSHYSVVFL